MAGAVVAADECRVIRKVRAPVFFPAPNRAVKHLQDREAVLEVNRAINHFLYEGA